MILMASMLTACGDKGIWMPYSVSSSNSETDIISQDSDNSDILMTAFASDLAVFSDDVRFNEFLLTNATAGILVDVDNKETIFSQNAFQRMYPASITKIMTALVAIENCPLDDIITCTEAVEDTGFSDAVVLGLKKGDKLTLDQALRLALISSYNDVSIAIAVHVAGDVESFAQMMNEKALSLGATQTHFANSTGLPDDNHYTSIYDLYLIFNEVIKNPTLLEIIQSKNYQTSYKDINNNDVNTTANSTNRYFAGYYNPPENITIIGGKTGTTTEAGYCLLLLAKDTSSKPYIAIILQADGFDSLYNQMSEMLTCTQ